MLIHVQMFRANHDNDKTPLQPPTVVHINQHAKSSPTTCLWSLLLSTEPGFLFRARELSDLESALDPSTKALLTVSLPALPILMLGLLCLEAKDLVRYLVMAALAAYPLAEHTVLRGARAWQSMFIMCLDFTSPTVVRVVVQGCHMSDSLYSESTCGVLPLCVPALVLTHRRHMFFSDVT